MLSVPRLDCKITSQVKQVDRPGGVSTTTSWHTLSANYAFGNIQFILDLGTKRICIISPLRPLTNKCTMFKQLRDSQTQTEFCLSETETRPSENVVDSERRSFSSSDAHV